MITVIILALAVFAVVMFRSAWKEINTPETIQQENLVLEPIVSVEPTNVQPLDQVIVKKPRKPRKPKTTDTK